ncbi:HNH endonuclease signature motif containing protein [Dietzia maris]|uniref:HNH endonuclease signature motif containing protein n=1 Tax=Dietzia maris TaxID=37915 RepID=UPI0037C8733A
MVIEVKNREVLIDEQDLKLVSKYKWHISSTGYVVWRGRLNGKRKTIRMHRLITNCPEGLVVDHINHNPLDNRRANLRVCTQAVNARNRKDHGNGYYFHKQNQNWVVALNSKHIGCFDTEDEAIRIVAHLRAGGTYTKPPQTHCKHGHSLDDAYRYGASVVCRRCTLKRQAIRFKLTYEPKPRQPVLTCPRGHDKRITRTPKGDCSECVPIRTKEHLERKRNARKT